MKPKILVLTDWFDPGFRAGGPIRSTVNFAKNMQDDLDIWVFTGYKDLGQELPYPGLTYDQWLDYDRKVKVFYGTEKYQNLSGLKKIIKEISPDFIYLNSMFSKSFTILPLILKIVNFYQGQVVLAPRGMLKDSAFKKGIIKKRLFTGILKTLKIVNRIKFQATDKEEVKAIQNKLSRKAQITQIPNIPIKTPPFRTKTELKPVKMIFVGRIHPIKGLDYAIRCLKDIDRPIELSVVGILEESAYWNQCLELIKMLPSAIKVNYLGEMDHHSLFECMQKHHFLLLPTKGENFGHAIFEGFAAGLPAIISDQTPWRNLIAQKIGWDTDLNNHNQFSTRILEAASMDEATYELWSRNAWAFANRFHETSGLKAAYLKLFS